MGTKTPTLRLAYLTLLASYILGCSPSEPGPQANPTSTPDETLIVEAESIRDQGFEGLVLDTRPRAEYEAGHVPGAISLPTNGTFAEPPEENNFLVKNIGEIQQMFRLHGIDTEVPVLVYDNGDFKDASRMFWLMDSHGISKVSVLNGGWGAWLEAGGEQSTEAPEPPKASTFEVVMRPDRHVLKMEVLQAIQDDSIEIIDARPHSDYIGETANEFRGGHIPTATNIEWTNNKRDLGTHWKLKAPDELAGLYETLPDNSQLIVYCNKGKQSAVAYLALRRIGRAVAAYDGSWYEWSKDTAAPISTPPQEDD